MTALVSAWVKAHWVALAACLVALVSFMAFAALVVDTRHVMRTSAARQQAEADAKNAADTSQAQAAARVDDSARYRESAVTRRQQEHAHAIQFSNYSAVAPVSVADSDAWRKRLCEYASTASDPACAGLRGQHTPKLSSGGTVR